MNNKWLFYRALLFMSLGVLLIFVVLLIVRWIYSRPVEPITALNQTYEGTIVDIKATDMKVVNDPLEDAGVIIGVRFVITNKTKKDFYLGPSSFSAYVDDIVADGRTTTDFNEAGEELGGNIAPGKSAVGYYAVEASKDAQKVEIRIEEVFEKKYATFIFDIPGAEG